MGLFCLVQWKVIHYMLRSVCFVCFVWHSPIPIPIPLPIAGMVIPFPLLDATSAAARDSVAYPDRESK